MSKRRRKQTDNCLQINDEKKLKSDVNNSHEIDSGITSQYFMKCPPINKISSNFFSNVSCIQLAKALLGQILCRRLPSNGQTLKGRIVETEAYIGTEDAACQTYQGRRTERNEPMYMKPGTCYVYFTYGMYYCFNISSEGEGAAVLLRAIEPLEGIDCMQQLRAKARKTNDDSKNKPLKLKMLSDGPSKLCMALDIDKDKINKLDITNSDEIWLERGVDVHEKDIMVGKRIGISRAGEWNDKPLRFYVKDCEFVSKK